MAVYLEPSPLLLTKLKGLKTDHSDTIWASLELMNNRLAVKIGAAENDSNICKYNINPLEKAVLNQVTTCWGISNIRWADRTEPFVQARHQCANLLHKHFGYSITHTARVLGRARRTIAHSLWRHQQLMLESAEYCRRYTQLLIIINTNKKDLH